MKRLLLLLALLAATFAACLAESAGKGAKDRVEVIYFHGKKRCPTCMAIEKCSREVVERDFARQKSEGKVVFRIVDISTKEGMKMAKDYRVTWSSLYVTVWQNGRERREDLTKFAFKTARTKPDEFKRKLKSKVQTGLKDR